MSGDDRERDVTTTGGRLERNVLMLAGALFVLGLAAMVVFDPHFAVIMSVSFWFSLAFATGVVLRAVRSTRARLTIALIVAAICFILTPLHGPFLLPSALVLVAGIADALWRADTASQAA